MLDEKEIKLDKEETKQDDYDFEVEMKKNAEKKKAAAEERKKINKDILKSYRIKS